MKIGLNQEIFDYRSLELFSIILSKYSLIKQSPYPGNCIIRGYWYVKNAKFSLLLKLLSLRSTSFQIQINRSNTQTYDICKPTHYGVINNF